MKGYQADVGPGWWGKLYEENGRGLLWPKSGEEHVRPGEWNTYEIVAVGHSIRTRINGKPCVDLDDPAGAPRGVFAFQLHSGGATEVRFKDIRLELDPKRTGGRPGPASESVGLLTSRLGRGLVTEAQRSDRQMDSRIEGPVRRRANRPPARR